MGDWLTNLAGEGYAGAVMWTLGALVLLVLVLLAVRFFRGLGSGTFVAGGRNRLPRLAVVDAAAVDSQRRLVLVRRDDVEHLILIGGPSDIVVEQHIRPRGTEAEPPQRRPREAARPQPAVPRPRPAPVPPARPAPTQGRPEQPPPAERLPRSAPEGAPTLGPAQRLPRADEPELPSARRTEPEPPTEPAQPPRREPSPEPRAEERHEEVLVEEEIEISIGEERRTQPANEAARRPDVSIEEEMSRLLDDLSDDPKKES